MLRTTFRAAPAFALWLAVNQPAAAQNPPPRPSVSVNVNRGAVPDANAGVRVKSIIGATINLQGGSSAGTIGDIVMNSDGVAEYLIVDNGGKLVTVPWEAAHFNWQQPTAPPPAVPAPAIATINITPQKYQAIPTFTAQTYPNFYTPAYRTQVYESYGLTPGQGRRIERRIERREGVRP